MDEEVKTVLSYIEKIQNYEKRGYRNFSALITIMWGLLLFFAGIMDYYTYLINDLLFHFLPWLIASCEGIIFTIVVRKGIQRAFLDDPLDRENAKQKERAERRRALTTTIMIVIIWIGVFTFLALGLFFLIIPFVSLVVGLILLVNVHIGPTSPKLRQIGSLNAGIVIATSIGILTLFILTGMRFVQFYGMIAGTILGVTFVAFGLYYSKYEDHSSF
ncbi:MAG: hypothetical protein D6732_16715 [Methanobacteriota archaeon]|nr:MAG: hypothetical protein D6732_16715 [Euryarchaeota archaeon]